MIQIKAKNSLFRIALLQALADFNPIVYEESSAPDDILLICTDQEEASQFLETNPDGTIVLLGTHHPNADLEIKMPCVLNELKEQLHYLTVKSQSTCIFENSSFLFEGEKRLLTNKKTQDQIGLTEKETNLIAYLIKIFPQSASKADLLNEVWNYRPDTETHTVETHIYALRQKMGERYFDALITNTPDGYALATDSD